MSGVEGGACIASRITSAINRGGTASWAETYDPGLQLLDLLRIGVRQVGCLGRVFRQVEEFHLGRQQRQPSQLPVAFAHCGSERLDVVDDLIPRRGFPLADDRPDVQPVQRLAVGERSAGQTGNRRKHVHHMHHASGLAGLDPAGPVGESDDARPTFVERALSVSVRAVVWGQFADHRGLAGKLGIARAAVVAVENDQRVVGHVPFVQRAQHRGRSGRPSRQSSQHRPGATRRGSRHTCRAYSCGA